MKVKKQSLGSGTGFVVTNSGTSYLITNAHNLTGRDRVNGEIMSSTGAVPDTVHITHNASFGLGSWVVAAERLYDDNDQPLWLEHPTHGRAVDIVALPITVVHNVALLPHDLDRVELDDGARLELGVTSDVHVVGFPFAISAGGFTAIWTRGSVASELQIDFEDLPCFLIDARTRKGQSGSPVLFYVRPGSPFAYDDGSAGISPEPICELMGVYSGRINEESDLGFVWTTQALRDVIENGSRPASN